MELRGASLHFLKSFLTPTSPPLRPNGISLILVVIIKTKQEDSDDRIYETSAQSYVSKQGGCQGEFKLMKSLVRNHGHKSQSERVSERMRDCVRERGDGKT